MEGKITKVVSERGFFFVDNDYWCHNNNYGRAPLEGDIVDYEREIKNEKKNAKNVKFIRSAPNPLKEYFDELSKGYFTEKNYLKEEFIIAHPNFLANLFVQKGNKVNQVRNYYDHIINIAGVYKLNKDFNRVKIELNKIIPLAVKSLDKKNISTEFKEFIIENVKQAIKSEDAFVKGFLEHFGCIVNYFPSNN
jgi:hypothetical protein